MTNRLVVAVRNFFADGFKRKPAQACERQETGPEEPEYQAELERLQKLESLGRLVGGIAHDMNNVLSAIFAVTQTQMARHESVPGLVDALGTIERAAERGRDLVKGLVGLTRRDLQAPAPVDLNELLRQEAALLERTLMQRYRIQLDLEEALPPVLGEAGPLGSAVMHLCVNAVDAMAENGTLAIRSRRAGMGWVELVVEDSGAGMAPEVLVRAMDPLYSAKPGGRGTGLGLSMVLSTARAHGGNFVLRSRLGEGTQAILRLPAMDVSAAASPRRDAEGAPEPAGDAQDQARSAPLDILLVDDDILLRESVPGMLQLHGHRVEAVDGGKAALERLESVPLPDLVILDVNMPDMNGLVVLNRLRVRWPDLPVLLATGFLDEEASAAVARDSHARSLTKPFTLEEVSQVIGAMRAASAGSSAP
jgi:CheY-like chemotaxis protein/two-component sensor histidine kinase